MRYFFQKSTNLLEQLKRRDSVQVSTVSPSYQTEWWIPSTYQLDEAPNMTLIWEVSNLGVKHTD